jgi:uncharacterized membrane protein YagU involved in acid resistance
LGLNMKDTYIYIDKAGEGNPPEWRKQFRPFLFIFVISFAFVLLYRIFTQLYLLVSWHFQLLIKVLFHL